MSFWTTPRREYLALWAGKKTDARIAADLKCAAITVRKERKAMQLDGYKGRPGWDRRQALLNSISGLDFYVSH